MKKFVLLSIAIFLVSIVSAQDSAGKRTSLWGKGSSSLFSDPKARRINDIVIIKVEEQTKAENKGSTKLSKSASSSMGISKFLGFETDLAGSLTSSFDPTSLFGHSASNSNQGTGEVSQESKITGYIAAKVVEVLPNGNLIIEAKKEVVINNDKQTMILRGMVRPRDIDYNNIVSSNEVADVQIYIKGKGPISEQQKRGWLSWLLSFIWPF